MKPRQFVTPDVNHPLNIDEVRLVSDLRIMHAKVAELHQVVTMLKRRFHERVIHQFADQPVLDDDITLVDEIYLWFVSLKEERERRRA